jgi:hypothetical protein
MTVTYTFNILDVLEQELLVARLERRQILQELVEIDKEIDRRELEIERRIDRILQAEKLEQQKA